MEEERRQAHAQAALALLTASMEKDGVCDFPILLAMDLMDELGAGDEEAGALSLVMAMTSLAEHLLLRSSQDHGVSPRFELRSLSLSYAKSHKARAEADRSPREPR